MFTVLFDNASMPIDTPEFEPFVPITSPLLLMVTTLLDETSMPTDVPELVAFLPSIVPPLIFTTLVPERVIPLPSKPPDNRFTVVWFVTLIGGPIVVLMLCVPPSLYCA